MNEIICGDALDTLKTLPDGIVQTCVTSPPYFGLRDYGTAQWEGGSAECDHIARVMHPSKHSTLERHGKDGRSPQLDALPGIPYSQQCAKCGATRIDQQIGLEDTPEAYIARLVEVFREVRRVLRDDGTLWVNIGDSYAAGKCGRDDSGDNGRFGGPRLEPVQRRPAPGLKPKDLIGIPWMLAFALRADGWWLRSDIIWSKPNCMPESVTDRPTKAHEYIFLLSKSSSYYYDAQAIAEPATYAGDIISLGAKSFAKGQAAGARVNPSGNGLKDSYTVSSSRNKRSVWTVSTMPYSEAHFATFPPKLIEPCILAGSAPGDIVLDPFCGAGTVPLVALKYQRQYIGIELNPEYVKLINKRVHTTQPVLWEVGA